MSAKFLSRLCLSLLVIGLGLSSARADQIFIGSQAGYCCFNVDLHQIDNNDMQVTVSLTSGAPYFAHTGGGTHPGFAFNLSGDPSISVTSISSPWTLASVNLTSTGTNGPALGTFDYFIDNPGNGISAANAGPLVFVINDASGISYSSFVANASGFYFAADIMNNDGATGESGISTPGTLTSAPEPSSLLLFGTGIISAAGLIRRRFAKA